MDIINAIKVLLAIAVIILDIWLTYTLFMRFKRIEENTERAAEALEYIANRIDEESANNTLDKIEKELNSR